MAILQRAAMAAESFAGRLSCQEFFVAAVGIRSDGATVRATNKSTRTPGCGKQRAWATHAESRLCRKLDYGATVYVARYCRSGVWGMAKPCVRCEKRLRQRGVKMVYFTTAPGEYDSLTV